MVLKWEEIKCEMIVRSFFNAPNPVLRAKVPGGWFVRIAVGVADNAFFYPDPKHTWDGSSLP